MVSAITSEGVAFEYCVQVTEPILSTAANELFCASDSALVVAQAEAAQAEKPRATVRIVRKVVAK